MRMTEATYNYEQAQQFNPLVSYLHGIRYKRLLSVFATFPADKTIRVVDIGCAHAKTFGLLNNRFRIEYVGIEPDPTSVTAAAERYGDCENFRIIKGIAEDYMPEISRADIVLALETLEHIPEHLVVRLVEYIAVARPRMFMCTVPNEVGPILWVKNVGSLLCGYLRHREYTWRDTWNAGTYNLNVIDPHGISHKGFDWRWLAQTLRYNMRVAGMYSSPFGWLPKTISFSVHFVCVPYHEGKPAEEVTDRIAAEVGMVEGNR